jgi:hypothetical protein
MMRITFERSGGFMGRTTSLTLDLDDLPADQAEALRRLLDEADFLSLAGNTASRPAPDEFNYTITVEMDTVRHSVHTSDTSAPESLRPLLRELAERARPRRGA